MGFRVPGPDEFSGDGFGTLAADDYRCRIASYQMKQGAEVTNQYNLKGELRIWFTLEPLHIEGDEEAEMLDAVTNEPVKDDKTLLFFFDPSRLGLKPVVSKNRKFFAAAMGIPVEQPVEFDTVEDLAKALVGKEIVAAVEITASGKNKIADVRPVRQRQRRARGTESTPATNPTNPLAAAAASTFEGDVEATKEVATEESEY
jgi:hypothetical protein